MPQNKRLRIRFTGQNGWANREGQYAERVSVLKCFHHGADVTRKTAYGWMPATAAQQAALDSKADILLFGGSAGLAQDRNHVDGRGAGV